jgi:hypothetical protein
MISGVDGSGGQERGRGMVDDDVRTTGEATSWNRILFGLAMAADPNVVMAWPTPEETRRVLSGYLVNSGRKLAGLPPLG